MDLSSEEDVKKALKCNREYMGKSVWDASEVVLVLPVHVVLKHLRALGTQQGAESPQPQSEHGKGKGEMAHNAVHRSDMQGAGCADLSSGSLEQPVTLANLGGQQQSRS